MAYARQHRASQRSRAGIGIGIGANTSGVLAGYLTPTFIAAGTSSTSTAAGSDIGFTYPASVEANDLALAVLVINDRGAAADVAEPVSGWTTITKRENAELGLYAFYRIADGTEDSSAVTPFNWASGDATNDVAICQVLIWRNVDTSTPIDFTATPNDGTTTSVNMVTVGPTTAPVTTAVAVVGSTDNSTHANPTGETSSATWSNTISNITTASADDAAIRVFHAVLANYGDSITGGTCDSSNSTPQTDKSACIGFALRGKLG